MPATLLELVWQLEGDPAQVEQAVLFLVLTGQLMLAGNFRGQEHLLLRGE